MSKITLSKLLSKLAILCLLTLAFSACSSVAPWERDLLSQQQMSPGLHPGFNSIRSHVYESREAGARIDADSSSAACGCY